jgi:hypothetical protein
VATGLKGGLQSFPQETTEVPRLWPPRHVPSVGQTTIRGGFP